MSKVVTVPELADMTCMSANVLRTYLGHYTLEKFRTIARNERNYKRIGYVINSEFLKAFGDYLEKVRGLEFKERTLVLMDEYEKYWKGRK